jgi:hypothetical protein
MPSHKSGNFPALAAGFDGALDMSTLPPVQRQALPFLLSWNKSRGLL